MIEKILPVQLAEVLGQLPEAAGQLWLVGGAVRDHFLKRKTTDFDLAVAGEGRQVARRLADLLGGAYYDLDPQRDTARVLTHERGSSWSRIDLAGLRGESIEEDLRLRDFTVNSLAVSLGDEEFLDPTGGLQDLKDKRLSLTAPEALNSDPLRALRAVRLASELGFKMDRQLVGALRDPSLDLSQISAERIRDELFLMLAQSQPQIPLRLAHEMGLLASSLPSTRGLSLGKGLRRLQSLRLFFSTIVGDPAQKVGGDFLRAQASLRLGRFRRQLGRDLDILIAGDRSRRQLLGFAAVFGGNGADPGRKLEELGAHLHLSGAESAHLARISRYLHAHAGLMLPQDRSRLAIYRHYRDYGISGVDLILLGLAEYLRKGFDEITHAEWESQVDTARAYLQAWYEQRALAVDPPALLGGQDLMRELGIGAGPLVGDLLEALREAQVQGQISDSEAAIRFARGQLNALRGDGEQS